MDVPSVPLKTNNRDEKAIHSNSYSHIITAKLLRHHYVWHQAKGEN
jgi:hypothetical protein